MITNAADFLIPREPDYSKHVVRTLLVPGGGLEPPHLAAADFESAASTNSAIPARIQHVIPRVLAESGIMPQSLKRINGWIACLHKIPLYQAKSNNPSPG